MMRQLCDFSMFQLKNFDLLGESVVMIFLLWVVLDCARHD